MLFWAIPPFLSMVPYDDWFLAYFCQIKQCLKAQNVNGSIYAGLEAAFHGHYS